MGKELLFKVLRHEEAERVPWVPFAGVHAGKLKGYNAREVLESADKLYESLLEVNMLRKEAGLYLINAEENKNIVTNCDGIKYKSNHQARRKFILR